MNPSPTPSNFTACTEADVFARNLLMPELMVYEQCLKLAEAEIPRDKYADWIAPLFGVPKDKALYRLKELRIV
jgi:Zn-dependent peptidase ImmA (M78 family)